MKDRIYLAILLVSTCLSLNSAAQTASDSALLYRITGPKLKKPSYLFGTIHLVCEKDFRFREKLVTYLAHADRIVLEVNLDDPLVLQKVAKISLMANGKSLKDYLTAEEFARLDNLYKAHLGISFELLQEMKPMMASTALLMSPKITGCLQPQMLERALVDLAKERRMSIVGLESAEEQLAVIDSVPISDQIKWLKDLSANPERTIGQFQSLYKVYLAQNSDALYQSVTQQLAEHGNSQETMLDRRNANWIPLIEENIALAPTFIAVGAGHLGGKKGVLQLLRAKGYTLTPIRL